MAVSRIGRSVSASIRIAASRRSPADFRALPRTRQRPASAFSVQGGTGPFPAAVRRQEDDDVRLDADPLHNVISVLKNPFSAGAYAYGKSRESNPGSSIAGR